MLEERLIYIVAHCLAKLALSWFLDEVWMEECSSLIRNVIFAEQVIFDSSMKLPIFSKKKKESEYVFQLFKI
jgi:hypothetical protein